MQTEIERVQAHRIAEDLGVLAPDLVLTRTAAVRRCVRAGRWQRAGRCVVMHSGPLSSEQLLWAASLSPRGTSAVARESALRMAGVTGVSTPDLTVLVAWGQRPISIAGVRYVQSRHLRLADVVLRSQPLRCTAARATVDAASRASPDWARTLVAMVVQQRKATAADLRAVLDRLSPVRREVLLRLTVDDVEGGAHSLPELRFTRLVRASGLPVPDRQVIRRRPDGRYFLDAAWEEFGLVVEVDGSHHRNADQWEADVLRQDELMIGGDRVLRLVSWWIRDRPDLVVDLLRRALLAGGWRP